MSHKASVRVWEHSKTRGAMRCLMLAIADLANDDGVCWPGTAHLAEKINESTEHTATIIKKCIESGELERVLGQGRGHKTRYAVLCGLPPDAQKALKGVLQKGYSGTPITKRGTTKGVLSSGKRGTFSDAKQSSFEAPARDETAIGRNDIHHDPNHDGDGGGAHARKVLRDAGLFNGTIRQILALHIDPATLITSVQNLAADGWGAGAIADELRDNPPPKGQPYERHSTPAPPERTAHGGRGGRTERSRTGRGAAASGDDAGAAAYYAEIANAPPLDLDV